MINRIEVCYIWGQLRSFRSEFSRISGVLLSKLIPHVTDFLSMLYQNVTSLFSANNELQTIINHFDKIYEWI